MEGNVAPLKLFLAFLRLGCTAFGGPAMVKYIKDLACRKNGWVKKEDFDHGVALVQTIPGATAMQAAAYAGLKAGGGIGALAAYTGFSLPAFVFMTILSVVYLHAIDLRPVEACFLGFKVIVVAIVANATISFGRKMVRSWQDVLLVAAAAGYLVIKGSPVTAIIVCGLAGIFLYPGIGGKEGAKGTKGFRELMSAESVRFAGLVTAAVAVMLAVLFFLDPLLGKLCALMMKIDFFAYGGGYASLPLMLHEVVDKRHLLSAKVLMDGIALGQVTPGPIVITAAFVGYLLKGFLGAAACTWAIFTPSFLILLVAAPVFENFRNAPVFRRCMRGVLSSFVGLLLAVFISFVLAISWKVASVLLAIAAFLALNLKVDILWVVLAGGGLAIIFL